MDYTPCLRSGVFFMLLLFFSAAIAGCTHDNAAVPDNSTIAITFTERQAAISDYQGTVLVKYSDGQSENFHIRVRYPDKIRIDYLDSPIRHAGTVAILNASIYTEYSPSANETIVFETDPEGNSIASHDMQGFLKTIIPKSEICYAGSATIENRRVYTIEMTSDQLQYYDVKSSEYRLSRARVFVDPKSWRATRIEFYQPFQPAPVITADYRDLVTNSGIADIWFDETPLLQYTIVRPPTHPPIVFQTMPTVPEA